MPLDEQELQDLEVLTNRTLDARAFRLAVFTSASLAGAIIWGAQRYITALDELSTAVNTLSTRTEVLTIEVKYLQKEVGYLKAMAVKERAQ